MDTYQIEIIEPRAKKLLDDMADMDLITVQPLVNGVKPKAKAAFASFSAKVKAVIRTAVTTTELMPISPALT